ncbi:MAG: sulfotransferase family 2 domain-containing protein [Paracoccaceae bacterium]
MIISRGRRFIFVHIPKTGGTAFAHAYDDRAMKDDILIGDTPKARRRRGRLSTLSPAGRLWKHSTLRDIDGIIGPEEMQAWQVVTLVRNPWDRLVSYYHWLRDQRFAHPAVALAQAQEFGDFIRHPQTQASIRNSPATSYVTDARGVLRGTCFVRLEHVATDAQPLWQHLGFSLDLPHLNTSARDRDYRRYYGADTADLVAQMAAADIARFGYRFDPA